jgi:RNA polymerase sigma factor (sigma-70 family)
MAHKLVQTIRRLALAHHGTEWTSGQLLGRYVSHRDDVAFEVLVRRHGPLVMGVCRRILRDAHDAEDAFQATFLVLARKAASIGDREKLSNWLYGVACLTARRAKVMNAKRRQRERPMAVLPEVERVEDRGARELQAMLDDALRRLPEKYRLPVLLCELEGKSHKEAARELGWPIGTLSGRLSRARALLAKRLARRGVVAGATWAMAAHEASASVAASLVAATVKTANAGVKVPGAITTLAEGVLKTMLATKLKNALAAVLVVVALLGSGTVGFRKHFAAAASPDERAAASRNEPPGAPKPNSLRCYGLLEKIDAQNRTLTAIPLKGTCADDVAALLMAYLRRSADSEASSLPALTNLRVSQGARIHQAGKPIKLADLGDRRIVQLELAVSGTGLEIVEIEQEKRREPVQHIAYRFRHLPATDAVSLLREAFGPDREDFTLAAEPVNNSLLMRGNDFDLHTCMAILSQIDSEAGDEIVGIQKRREHDRRKGAVVTVTTLKHLIAAETAKVLREAFGRGREEAGIELRITVDERSNSVIASGSNLDSQTILRLLGRLDEEAGKKKEGR